MTGNGIGCVDLVFAGFFSDFSHQVVARKVGGVGL